MMGVGGGNWIVGCLVGVGDVATLGCIPSVMANIVNALFLFAGIVCVALIIGSGYKLMNNGGDPKKLESAQKTLVHAISGLLLVLVAIFIISLISQVTRVDCITQFRLIC